MKIRDIKIYQHILYHKIKKTQVHNYKKSIQIFAFFLIWDYNCIKDFLYLICMKMNKFRVNLHPAFFDPKTWVEYHWSSDHEFEENDGTKRPSGYYFNENTYDARDNTYKGGELDEFVVVGKKLNNPDRTSGDSAEWLRTTLEHKGQVDELEDAVIQNSGFQSEIQNVTWTVASEISSEYTDMEQLKRDRSRFQERLRSKDSNWEEYARIWEKKIAEWFWFLKTSLKERGYFNGKNENEELSRIRELYMKEVSAQYDKYIWRASEKTFDSIKDNIFWDGSEDYPANKIYCQLTWATSISIVDRRYVEWHDTDVLEPISLDGVDDASKDMSERQDRNFLSDDLPQYLWNIRKTPWVLNVMKWLPIFSVKEDRPSKVDRKAIRQFLKVSSKINVEWDKAVALMQALHDNRLNTNSGEADYENVLRDHKITVDKKYLDDIVKVGSFYINTQRVGNADRDQHAIYLSVLKIIESEGWVDNAVKKFKTIVEQAEKDKKAEKKEWYESGELLDKDTREFMEKLWITDFVSATRLIKKDVSYFKDTPVEKILANLNNDRIIDARDATVGWAKSGAQFLEVFNQVWEDKALTNLLEHAKLMNKTLWLNLDESRFTKERIQQWDFNLILLLQNIISKPGEDLYTLLSGHSENPFEWLDLAAEKAAADEAAENMIKKMDLEALKKDGLTLPTPESMQSGLATALYTEYKRGIWLWGKVSFDQWIKWVEMNTGFQVRDDKTVMIWIGLDYSKKIDLWKWWSTTPELSAWAFIPLWMWRPELAGSAWFNNEVAKEWITKNWIKEHLGLRAGATLMPAGVVVLSAWFNWNQDKLAWIESAEQKKMVEFRDTIISSILDKISEKGSTILDFNNSTLVANVKSSILEVANSKDENGNILVPEDKQEMVTNAVMRLLLNYNNANLAQEWVKDIIAQWVAEQYAMAWAEDRKAHITDKAYLSWASLWAFWVAGSPLVWIYAWIKFTKHDLDGYGDRIGQERSLDNSERWWERNAEMIGDLNQRLGLSPEKWLKINSDWYIVVPQSFVHRVLVSDDMKNLMKKDESGNILLDTHTPMHERVWSWSATQWTELLIWSKPDKKKLDQVWPDWFTTENIDQNAVLALNEGIDNYNINVLNKALNDLKWKISNENDPIKQWDFSKLTPEEQQWLIDKFNALDKNQKIRLILVNNRGEIEVSNPQNMGEWRWLEVEYQTKAEMIDAKAKSVADDVYAEALKLRNPRALNAVKHQPWDEYRKFNTSMQNREYAQAKADVESLFTRLDREISDENVNFKKVLDWDAFKNLEGDALVQALMSINNIFARSKQVRWWSWNYEFIWPNGAPKEMRAIIAERYKILNTLEWRNDIDDQAKWRYRQLFDATSDYVNNPDNGYAVKSTKAAHLGNTVWFNLWDKTNPENPLFNPEIYDPVVKLDQLNQEKFTQEAKEGLHKRAMTLFAKNPALVNPILKAVWVDTSNLDLGSLVNSENMRINWDKCELTLDINGKKVTISAWMEFWFFTQCVNHTIILDNISAETDETNVTFNSGVWKDGVYQEWSQSIIDSTTEVGASVSVVVSDKKPEEEPKPDATTKPTEEESDIPETPGTTTPWATDGGEVNTGWSAEQWGGWQGWSQSGDRPGEWTWDNTPPTWDKWSTDEWELEPDRN